MSISITLRAPAWVPSLLLGLAACGGGSRTSINPELTIWREAGIVGARSDHALVFEEHTGLTLLFGGIPAGNTWLLGPQSWERMSVTSEPQARFGHAMAYDPIRRAIVLFGGSTETGALDDTWIWQSPSWTRMAPAHHPPARTLHRLAFDPVRKTVVLFGGTNLIGGQQYGPYSDCWEWDGSDWKELTEPKPPPARFAHAMATHGTIGIIVHGGGGRVGLLDDTWLWDGKAWSQLTTGEAPAARAFHTLTPTARQDELVLFGGLATSALDDTWILSGGQWRRAPGSQQPTARFSHSCAFRKSSSDVVLFGGNLDLVNASDTWSWTELGWTRLLPHAHPAARTGHAMASTGTVAVLFGGNVSNSAVASSPALSAIVNDTWVWAGYSWRYQEPLTRPPARQSHAMAADTDRGCWVVFGGVDAVGANLGDTWEWDGLDWKLVATSGPAPRSGHAMAFDPLRKAVVLFGGHTTAGMQNDLWEWNGKQWAERPRSARPPARESHALAWCAGTNELVLFGGFDGAEVLGDTWLWDGSTWRAPVLANAPAARRFAGSAGSSAVHENVLLQGGEAKGIPTDDAWEWTGEAWRPAQHHGTPGALSGHTLVRNDRFVVCFGGRIDRLPVQSTWLLIPIVYL